MVDLVSLLANAQRLVKASGRSVTFIRHNQTLSDPAKPWLGPTDPRASPDTTSVQSAVFVEPSSAVRLGIASEQSDLIMMSEQIMIVSAGTVDLTTFQEVLDDGVYWKITKIELLKPGSTAMLAFVGVKR